MSQIPNYKHYNARQIIRICLVFSISYLGFFLLSQTAEAGLIIQRPLYIGLANGLVGFWSFSENKISGTTVADESGQGNNGTLTNGPKKAPGKIGQALSFDGVNDYVGFGNILDIPSGDFTYTAWFNLRQFNSNNFGERLVAKGSTGNYARYTFDIYGPDAGASQGKLEFYYCEGTSSGPCTGYAVATVETVSVNQWYLGVVTRTGSTARIYLNGSLSNTATLGTGGTITNTNFEIGRTSRDWHTGDIWRADYFNGLIDEVRVYNRALTADEIKRLYRIGASTKINSSINAGNISQGLVGYWDFSELKMGTTSVSDLSGSANTGWLINGPKKVIGKIGQALNFDGVDDYVNVGNIGDIKTLSYWIKTGTNNFSAMPYNGSTYYKDGVSASLLGSELVSNGNFDSNITGWSVVVGSPPSSISWQNAASGDGSTGYMRFSIASNGDWDRFYSTSGVFSANTTYKVSFWYRTSGITGNLGVYAADNINTLANNVQSAKIVPTTSWKYVSLVLKTNSLSYSVFTIAKLGNVGSGTFDIDAISVKSLDASISNGWHHVAITSDNSIYAGSMDIGYLQDTSANGRFTGLIDDVRVYNRALSPDEIKRLYRIGASTKINSSINAGNISQGLVGFWSFSENKISGTTVADESGQGNNGTLTNGPTRQIGKIGQALSFDGVDDEVFISSTPVTAAPLSLCAWVYRTASTPTDATVVTVTDSALTNHFSLELLATDRVRARILGSAGASASAPAGTVPVGGWHHACAVFASITSRSIYVDGVNQASNSTSVTVTGTDRIRIGNGAKGIFPNGLIDEVRVYNRALSAEEIKRLYNLGR